MDSPIASVKERLNKALSEKGVTAAELSRRTGISKGSISQYKNGVVNPKQDRIYLLANALGVSEAWLMGYDVPMGREARNKWVRGGIWEKEEEEEKPRRERGNLILPENLQIHLNTVPVYDPISCGTGKWVDEQPVDYLGVPDTMISKSGHYFANPAYGDSMEPRIQNGDYIVFEETPAIEPGSIGAFSLNGEYFCKRFKKLPDGSMWLFSENPLYDPIPIQRDDDFRVLGKYRMRMTEN